MIRKYVLNFPRLNQTSFTLCTFQYLTFFCVLKLDAPVPQSICQSKYSCPLRVFNTLCYVYGIGYVIFKITNENIYDRQFYSFKPNTTSFRNYFHNFHCFVFHKREAQSKHFPGKQKATITMPQKSLCPRKTENFTIQLF